MTRSDELNELNELIDSMDSSELTYDVEEEEEEISACERCGEPVGFLYEITDEDPSVGYSAVIWVCGACKGERR